MNKFSEHVKRASRAMHDSASKEYLLEIIEGVKSGNSRVNCLAFGTKTDFEGRTKESVEMHVAPVVFGGRSFSITIEEK